MPFFIILTGDANNFIVFLEQKGNDGYLYKSISANLSVEFFKCFVFSCAFYPFICFLQAIKKNTDATKDLKQSEFDTLSDMIDN